MHKRTSFKVRSLQNLLLLLYLNQRPGPSMAQSESELNYGTTNGCVCPGDILTYNCTIHGSRGGFTIWNGTALKCVGRTIILRHNSFPTVIGECNNGGIVAQGIGVEGNSYTSQLQVNVTSDLSGKTVECVSDNGTLASVIAQFIIKVPEDQYPPPRNIHTSTIDLSTREITFTWNPMAPDCLGVSYGILSSNCGSCPTTTTNTTVTCAGVPLDGSACTLAIQTLVCGTGGNHSDPIHIHFTPVDEGTCACTGTILSTSLLAVTLLLWITISTTIIAALVVKAKVKVQCDSQLANPQSQQYEDIRPLPMDVHTTTNVAYATSNIS